MSPIVLLLADGNAFFLGMVMVAVTVMVPWWTRHSLGCLAQANLSTIVPQVAKGRPEDPY